MEAVQNRLRAALDPENDFQDPSSSSSEKETSHKFPKPLAGVTFTRNEIISILKSELSEAIVLPYKTDKIDEVIDIALIESTVTDALGDGLVRELGLGFVPELGSDGKSLWMHLTFEDNNPR